MPPDSRDAADPPRGGAAGSWHPPANPYAHSYTYGRFTVVEVSGEIDMATAGSLAEHLLAACAGAEPDVLVDLRRVTFFDCSGLRVLCRADTGTRERGGRLRIVSDRPRVHRVLSAAGVLSRFPPLPELPPTSRPQGGSEPDPRP